MRLGAFTFKPAIVPSLVTLLILPVLLSLGFWQLDRAHQKETLLRAFKSQIALPYVSVTSVDVSDPLSHYRKVTAEGRYDSEHQILLDNQIQNGRPGYHVFTPLWLAAQQRAILVNRGWVPMGASRQQLPEIPVQDANTTLKGRVGQPANPGLRLGETDLASQDWPKVVLFVDYEQIATELDYPLAPAVILLDPDVADGYRREWNPNFGGMGPEIHQGYAVQWFSLATALIVIYIVVNTRRRRTEEI